MKIAIVSTCRSRSTLLNDVLSQENPQLVNLYEHYTRKTTVDKRQDIGKITEELFQQRKNFIVKILARNIGFGWGTPQDLQLDKYDKLYLLERRKFYDQLCSYEVAVRSQVWNQRKNEDLYSSLAGKTFRFEKIWTPIQLGMDIAQYLRIKKYLKDNNIPFEQKYYMYAVPKDKFEASNIKENDLVYEEVIENYHEMKPLIEPIFYKNFNYDTCEVNGKAYLQGLRELYNDPYPQAEEIWKGLL